MSSIQQPGRKRPRFDSNNNVNSQNNNCTTSNLGILSLPDEALNNIISYSMPRLDSLVWQWIGRLSQTCTSFRRFAQTYAPTRIELNDFENYCQIDSWDVSDVRVGFLRSLRDCSWKRQHIIEFHVNAESVLRERERRDGEEPIPRAHQMFECNDIKTLLRALITTTSSFPELEWLDIELQSDDIYEYSLVDAESLPVIPDALPSLHKLCLCQCFKSGIRETSPHQLRQFFSNLHTPLTSLSIEGVGWMTDSHVGAIMPIIGENLVCLELVGCVAYEESYDNAIFLSDNSLILLLNIAINLSHFQWLARTLLAVVLRWY